MQTFQHPKDGKRIPVEVTFNYIQFGGEDFEIKDKILDPYFTTKSDGTGIGLSISHRIVTDHGGSLTVLGSDLGGVEFWIEIPIRTIKKARESNKVNA